MAVFGVLWYLNSMNFNLFEFISQGVDMVDVKIMFLSVYDLSIIAKQHFNLLLLLSYKSKDINPESHLPTLIGFVVSNITLKIREI